MIKNSEDEPGSVVALMTRAQGGDRLAFDELQRIGESRGISYTGGWSAQMILFRLQDRASPKNLLARAAVEEDLKATIRDLADAGDGPIERLLIGRAALCAIDAGMADYEHLWSVGHSDHAATVEANDRRRDRAHRRLLSTLKVLMEARRSRRLPAQVSIRDQNGDRLKT